MPLHFRQGGHVCRKGRDDRTLVWPWKYSKENAFIASVIVRAQHSKWYCFDGSNRYHLQELTLPRGEKNKTKLNFVRLRRPWWRRFMAQTPVVNFSSLFGNFSCGVKKPSRSSVLPKFCLKSSRSQTLLFVAYLNELNGYRHTTVNNWLFNGLVCKCSECRVTHWSGVIAWKRTTNK